MENKEVKTADGPKFETHTAQEMSQFTHGTHKSQLPPEEGTPAGATGPKPGDVGTTAPSGPKPGDQGATGPKAEDVLAGIFPDATDPKEKELNDLRAKVKAYEDKTAVPSLKSEKLYKLQVIETETPDEGPLYWQYLSGNLDSVSLWKLGFLKDNPEYKDKPEEVQMFLEHKFPVLFDPGVDKTSNEYRIAKMDFDLESKKVRSSLDSRLNQIQIPKPEVPGEAGVQERTELVSKWKPDFVTLATEHDKVKITVPVSEGVEEQVEFPVPADIKRKVFEDAAIFVLSSKLPQGAESTQKVREYIMDRLKVYGFNSITGALIRQAVQKRDAEWKKVTGNNVKIESVTQSRESGMDSQAQFVADVLEKTQQRKK